MPDQMDMAQEQHQLMLDAQIKNATNRPTAPSAFHCEECDAPIPERRRHLIQGVRTCVICQEVIETKSHHIKGIEM
ncbi:TraR/DksA family transcriptional regulator [Gibbsiella quercinecans]|uniref:TraR/DksA family transcriptional regulator n=1 Tax=Gibbsiella quercinecans TaxID=929813 RepID=UPI003A4E63F0